MELESVAEALHLGVKNVFNLKNRFTRDKKA
jgi:hypothetical protein